MELRKRMLKPAETLEEVYQTLSNEPLMKKEELEAFYRDQVNEVRGGDKMIRLQHGLERAYHGLPFKALLAGHPGVGKSTELTKLSVRMEDKYCPIRFSATSELNPVTFQPFDILLLMMAEVAERTARPKAEGGAGEAPSENLLKEIWNWFAEEVKTATTFTQVGATIDAGIGISGESWWAKALGLFASLKGEIKYSADREKKIIEYRLNRLSDLISLANKLLDECNHLLWNSVDKEWLFIGEDFDKPGISPAQIKALFIDNANILKDLRAHLIFTIPVTLAYSEQQPQLPALHYSILDIPVYDQNHRVHKEGCAAVQAVLQARIDPKLFGQGQMNRLIIASGGNLRDLFTLASESAENALIRNSKKIAKIDVTRAINNLRTEYVRRLGESPFDKEKIVYDSKAELLERIYNRAEKSNVPNPILHSLIRARVVQEFNDTNWYGVHPLVVDILKEQKVLPGDAPGGTE